MLDLVYSLSAILARRSRLDFGYRGFGAIVLVSDPSVIVLHPIDNVRRTAHALLGWLAVRKVVSLAGSLHLVCAILSWWCHVTFVLIVDVAVAILISLEGWQVLISFPWFWVTIVFVDRRSRAARAMLGGWVVNEEVWGAALPFHLRGTHIYIQRKHRFDCSFHCELSPGGVSDISSLEVLGWHVEWRFTICVCGFSFWTFNRFVCVPTTILFEFSRNFTICQALSLLRSFRVNEVPTRTNFIHSNFAFHQSPTSFFCRSVVITGVRSLFIDLSI